MKNEWLITAILLPLIFASFAYTYAKGEKAEVKAEKIAEQVQDTNIKVTEIYTFLKYKLKLEEASCPTETGKND